MWHFGLGRALGIYFFGLLTGIFGTVTLAQVFSLRPEPEGGGPFLYAMIGNLLVILVPGVIFFFSGRSKKEDKEEGGGKETISD